MSRAGQLSIIRHAGGCGGDVPAGEDDFLFLSRRKSSVIVDELF